MVADLPARSCKHVSCDANRRSWISSAASGEESEASFGTRHNRFRTFDVDIFERHVTANAFNRGATTRTVQHNAAIFASKTVVDVPAPLVTLALSTFNG